KQLAGLTFHVARKSGSEREPPNVISFWTQAKAGPDDTLLIKGLYPGTYALHPQQNAEVPLEAQASAPFVVQSGKATKVTVVVKTQARVQGRILDRATGNGIAGVSVMVTSPTERGYADVHGWTQTDAAGRFSAYVRPGKLSFSFQAPAGYLQPKEESRETQ